MNGKLMTKETLKASMSIGAVPVPGPMGPQGPAGPQGPKGDTGKSLQFKWSGTQLGVKQEGQPQYTYVNLQGPQGPAGSGSSGDGTSPTEQLLRAEENKLALNEKSDGTGSDIFIQNYENQFRFMGTNKQVTATIRQNGSEPNGALCLDALNPCLISPIASDAQNSNAYPVLENGTPKWVKTTSYEWSEPYSELNAPGTYCINSQGEFWYMDNDYIRRKLVSSDYMAFQLFKTEDEIAKANNTEKKISMLELLSDEFKAELDEYIQSKIDRALENIAKK